MDSILSALGSGSGIDTKALVVQLVDAQFEFKNKTLTSRSETLGAQISAVAQLKSGITNFSAALTALVNGGSLSNKPVSGDPSMFTVAGLPGARLGALNVELEVTQLAKSQVVTAAAVADASAAVGMGTLTFSLGAATHTAGALTGFTADPDRTPVTMTIGATNNSLTGIAAAINAAGAGVTASVITDSSGARLSIKGQSGAEQAFRIDVAEDGGAPGLAAFSYAPGASTMTTSRAASDSVVVLDGVTVTRPGNDISDLIPGLRVNLLKAEVGRVVSIGAERVNGAVGQAVADFVMAFNELRSILRADTDAQTGVLRGDTGARDMARQMASLTSTPLGNSAVTGAPRTLAEIGVQTNRDGSLTLNSERLNAALAADPNAVEALISPPPGAALGDVGLIGALDAIADRLTDNDRGLSASEERYTKLQARIAEDQAKALDQAEKLRERLTLQFGSMDARVAAYKSTQSFLDQQIALWTKDS